MIITLKRDRSDKLWPPGDSLLTGARYFYCNTLKAFHEYQYTMLHYKENEESKDHEHEKCHKKIKFKNQISTCANASSFEKYSKNAISLDTMTSNKIIGSNISLHKELRTPNSFNMFAIVSVWRPVMGKPPECSHKSFQTCASIVDCINSVWAVKRLDHFEFICDIRQTSIQVAFIKLLSKSLQ